MKIKNTTDFVYFTEVADLHNTPLTRFVVPNSLALYVKQPFGWSCVET